MEVGLSLGSNEGDRLAYLRRARRCIGALPETSVVACSPVYETRPVDVADEFRHLKFLNAALVIESDLGLDDLAARLHATEADMDRRRDASTRNSPRTIDIDVIYADEIEMESASLQLPHPRWAERAFVLRPLADVRGARVLPGQVRPVATLAAALPTDDAVALYRQEW